MAYVYRLELTDENIELYEVNLLQENMHVVTVV